MQFTHLFIIHPFSIFFVAWTWSYLLVAQAGSCQTLHFCTSAFNPRTNSVYTHQYTFSHKCIHSISILPTLPLSIHYNFCPVHPNFDFDVVLNNLTVLPQCWRHLTLIGITHSHHLRKIEGSYTVTTTVMGIVELHFSACELRYIAQRASHTSSNSERSERCYLYNIIFQ